MYETAVEEGYDDIVLAYCNNARGSLYSGSWTYEKMYSAFPFDNTVYIIEATAKEMMNEVSKWNFVYRSPSFDGIIHTGQKYKIAVLDYLLFHTNSYRYYDYFSDTKGNYIGKLSDNYRIILKNWLISNGYASAKLLDANDYSSSLTSFSRNFTEA